MKVFYKIQDEQVDLLQVQILNINVLHQFMYQMYRKLFYKILSPIACIVTAWQVEGLAS